jgi:hypothetical protein
MRALTSQPPALMWCSAVRVCIRNAQGRKLSIQLSNVVAVSCTLTRVRIYRSQTLAHTVLGLFSVTTTVVSQKVLGRTFMTVQLCRLNDFTLAIQPVRYSGT